MGRRKIIKNNCGSALLTALFIMTLVAIAVTAISIRLQLDIYRLRLTITSEQLYLASQSVIFWGMNELKQETLAVENINEQAMILKFPKQYEALYPQIKTTGEIYDLQARFNINNLQNKTYRNTFLQLLEMTRPDLPVNTRKMIVKAASNWINPQNLSHGQDPFIFYYLKQQPPYYPAFQPLASISEIRLLQGMEHTTYQALLPYLTALPDVTPININTASKPVLKLLGNGLTDIQVQTILNTRKEQGLLKPETVTQFIQKFNIPANQISTESHYYLVVAKTSSDKLQLTNFTVLERRREKKKKFTAHIIFESLNTL